MWRGWGERSRRRSRLAMRGLVGVGLGKEALDLMPLPCWGLLLFCSLFLHPCRTEIYALMKRGTEKSGNWVLEKGGEWIMEMPKSCPSSLES